MTGIGAFLGGPTEVPGREPLLGQPAPLFELADQDGNGVTLRRLTRRGPVILHLYRGHWWPTWRLYLTQLRQSYWEFRGLGVEFVAAANDTPEVNKTLREKLDLPFMLLSDVDGELAKAYHAFHENEPRDRKIALTSMFLIDSSDNDRIIRFENVGPTARHRVSGTRLVEEILNMRGQEDQLVSVLVWTEAELERQIAARNDPPLGFYTKPPADQIQGGVMVEHEVLGQMVMSQYEEIHRLTREGWQVVSVAPEVQRGETIGQRYVFKRGRA